MSFLRAALTVGGLTMVSRVLGFARDILMAAILGAGGVADAFVVAFKLPNFFRRLFAEGAFNAAFVPIFSEILTRDGRAAARHFAEQALAVLIAILFVLVALFQIAMPVIMIGLAPGFRDDPVQFDLAVALTRLTFPYLLFISLVSLMGGLLNALGRFAAVAATPILLNLCLVGAMLVAAPHLPTAGHALAWGVAVAGMAQLVWLAFACRRAGMALRLRRPRLSPAVKRLLVRMMPLAIGAGVTQVNLLVDVFLATLLPSGSVSYLYYADRLNQLPIGVVGVAVGTALLPMLSRQLAAGETAAAGRSMNRAIEFAVLLTLPAAAALLVVPSELVTVLFQRGAFGAAESQATAFALMAYAAGVPAYVLVKVLGPGYFARHDTRTPVKIALVALAANVILNLILMVPLKHTGLALATAISAWLNTILLAYVLYRRGHLVVDARLRARLPRSLAASLVMAAVLWALAQWLAAPLAGGDAQGIAALAVLVGGGLVVFALAAQLTGAARLGELRAMAKGGGA